MVKAKITSPLWFGLDRKRLLLLKALKNELVVKINLLIEELEGERWGDGETRRWGDGGEEVIVKSLLLEVNLVLMLVTISLPRFERERMRL